MPEMSSGCAVVQDAARYAIYGGATISDCSRAKTQVGTHSQCTRNKSVEAHNDSGGRDMPRRTAPFIVRQRYLMRTGGKQLY